MAKDGAGASAPFRLGQSALHSREGQRFTIAVSRASFHSAENSGSV